MYYSDRVRDHFTQPRQVGLFDLEDTTIGQARLESMDKRAIIRLQIKVQAERIADSRFQAFGCPWTIACGSWLSEWVIGKTLTQAQQLHNSDIIAALQLELLKVQAAVLAEQALHTAVKDYLSKQ